MKKILVVDDCNDLCRAISPAIKKNNYAVYHADSALAAMEWLKGNSPDLVLCDLQLKDVTGTQLFDKISKTHPRAIIMAMANEPNAKDAVAVFKSGARDFIAKTLSAGEILQTIKKLLAEGHGETTFNRAAGPDSKQTVAPAKVYNNEYLASDSTGFTAIMKQVALVAPTDFTVIICGESGSGKEAIARQIHEGSKRRGKPFVAIDCGALSKELAGSELFGHEKGAFTGALNQKTGSLETADGGTIFLDEIGNLPYEIQVSLLRVVQERKIKRVGGINDISIDVRIVVASNINLWDAAKAGKFREDLYHRFNEFSIAVPPLRERTQDILPLARHFLKYTNADLDKNIKGFTKEVEHLLHNYVWYGNIRELRNVIKRVALLTTGDVVEITSLPFDILDYFRQQSKAPVPVKTEQHDILSNFNTYITYELKNEKVNAISAYEVTSGGLEKNSGNKGRRLKNGAICDVYIPAN